MIKKFVKAGSWVIGSNMVSKILNFIVLNYLARVLNPTGFGVYNALLTSAASINQMCDLGTTVVLQRTGARISELNTENAGNRFTIILLLQFVLNLIFTVTIYFYPHFFNQFLLQGIEENETIRLIGLVAIFQVISQIPLPFIMGLGEFRKYAVRIVLSNCITVLTVVLIVWSMGPTINNAVIALITSLLFNSILSWYILRQVLKKYSITLRLRNVIAELKSIFREGFIYYVGNVLAGAVSNILIISLFSKYLEIAEYGYIRIGGALIAIIGIIPGALQSVTITFLALKEIKGDQLKSIQLRYIGAISFFISVLLIFFLDQIIKLLFGVEYLPGRIIFVFIILSNIMIIISSVITNFLVSKGHTSYVGIVSTLSVCLSITAAFIFIPMIGIYGYFISQMIAYGVGFILVLRKEFRNYVYPDLKQLRKLAIILILGLVGLMPALFINHLVVSILYKCLFFITMLFLVLPLAITTYEKEKIVELIQRIRQGEVFVRK